MDMTILFWVTSIALVYTGFRFIRFKRKAKTAPVQEEEAPLSYDPEYIKTMNETFKRV